MHNKTFLERLLDTKDDIFNMPTAKMLLIVASIVFFVLMTRGRRTWLNFMHVAFFLEGIQYTFFPRSMSLWFTGEMDDVHVFLVRNMGLVCLAWALCYFLLARSTDSTTETSFLLALTVMLLTSLLAKGYLYNKPDKGTSSVKILTDEMSSMFYITLLSNAGTLFHLFRCSDWGGYAEQTSHANFHLRVEFVLLLIIGVMSFAVPQSAVKILADSDHNIDSVHAFLVRAIAAAQLAMAVLSVRSANFLRASDKDAVVVSHWIYYVAMVILGWFTLFGRWSELTWQRVILQCVVNLVIILNATGALDRDVTVFKRVVFPRFAAVPRDIRNYFKLKQI